MPQRIFVRYIFLFLSAFFVGKPLFAQPFDLGVGIRVASDYSNATGYYNHRNKTIVLNQPTQKGIARLLYDEDFNLLHRYESINDEISFYGKSKRTRFYCEVGTGSRYFEIYRDNKKLQLWELDFVNGSDRKVYEADIATYYPDESFISVVPQKDKVSYITYSEKQNKLLLHDLPFNKPEAAVTEYFLPENTLSETEKKKWGKHLAVNYSKSLRGMYVSDLNNVNKFEISAGNQLFYNDSSLFFSLRLPYNAGFHIVHISRNSEDVSVTNLIYNKTVRSNINTAREKVPTLTAVDSILVVLNNDHFSMEYYIYNISTGRILAKLSGDLSDTAGNLYHSELRQIGTYASRNAEKEIENAKTFLRKKNASLSYLKAFVMEDSLIITFGSYMPTEGIEGTLLSSVTSLPGMMFSPYRIGPFLLYPYLSSSRNKFLFGHSKFSLKTFQPSGNYEVTTLLNKIADDKKIDDLEKESSFVVETGSQVILGVFDKKEKEYRVFKY